MLYAFAIASALSIFFVIGFGRASARFGRRPVMIVGLVFFVLYLGPLFSLLTSTSWLVMILAFSIALARQVQFLTARASKALRVGTARP